MVVMGMICGVKYAFVRNYGIHSLDILHYPHGNWGFRSVVDSVLVGTKVPAEEFSLYPRNYWMYNRAEEGMKGKIAFFVS